ncbi:MAG: GTPase ObgE [Candidatus Omnitrophota bacterium]
MFIDTAKIEVIAGNGGDGVDSFYRDKLTRKGHPDGGDGGKGGNVIIRVSTNVHTLIDFQYRQHVRAKDASHGSGKKKTGANGADCTILVPAGTLVFDYATGELIADLTQDNEEIIVAKGGEAGKGNRSHKDATEGKPGEQRVIRLELKSIADVGIIGLPNSGKSTLISKISRAHPKIASYPFTTTAPVLGIVSHNDFEFKVAEVPGLIKGAHTGKGLGDLFLRHVERTSLLIHLVDISEASQDPYSDYKDINEELRLYGKGLVKKDKILVANKIDVDSAKEKIDVLKKKIAKSKLRHNFFSISGATGEGIDALLDELCKRLKNAKK